MRWDRACPRHPPPRRRSGRILLRPTSPPPSSASTANPTSSRSPAELDGRWPAVVSTLTRDSGGSNNRTQPARDAVAGMLPLALLPCGRGIGSHPDPAQRRDRGPCRWSGGPPAGSGGGRRARSWPSAPTRTSARWPGRPPASWTWAGAACCLASSTRTSTRWRAACRAGCATCMTSPAPMPITTPIAAYAAAHPERHGSPAAAGRWRISPAAYPAARRLTDWCRTGR